MNKHSKKPPVLSPKEFSFTVEITETLLPLVVPFQRLINLSFVLGGVSVKFGMGVTSQDRFAGMGDLVCCWKDWQEAEMPSSIMSFT